MAALLSSLIFSFLFGGKFIAAASRLLRTKPRDWTPENHQKKGAMPTMGGIFILLVVVSNSLLWCNLKSIELFIFLGCLIAFGGVGFLDDWSKMKHRGGISAGLKFNLQLGLGLLVALALYMTGFSTTLTIPLFKSYNPDLGMLFIPWVAFILVGASNAVNLTDGLDGLAIGSLIPNFAIYVLICYLASNHFFASYLHMPYASCAEIVVAGATLVGASLGFLWYNAYPAQIFMGDVGSLALGAGFALMGIMAKQELLLPLSGGLFVIEAFSVIVQVASFKLFGRRVLRMAPIHHHFELLGWQESKITIRFAIVSVVLCLLAVMVIKIR